VAAVVHRSLHLTAVAAVVRRSQLLAVVRHNLHLAADSPAVVRRSLAVAAVVRRSQLLAVAVVECILAVDIPGLLVAVGNPGLDFG
jgi:hypothetical protein